MNVRSYLIVCGIVFGLVTVFHAIRVASGWPLILGPWTIPMWVSWCGVAVPATLTSLAFRLAFKS